MFLIYVCGINVYINWGREYKVGLSLFFILVVWVDVVFMKLGWFGGIDFLILVIVGYFSCFF